ncbi:MAG: FtsX-like permease family protein [Candidatus Limimorpha sp.]
MNLPLFISKRYLLAKKSHNLINIITWISIVSVAVAAFAMIFVLSVFNGFKELISESIHQTSPDLSITSVTGKTIDLTVFPLEKIQNIDNVELVIPTITEDVLFRNNDRQQIGQIKGVPPEYYEVERIKSSIINTNNIFMNKAEFDFAVPGATMAYYLGIDPNRPLSTIQVYVPRRGNASSFSLENSFNTGQLFVAQVFLSQQDIDETLVFAPYNVVSKLAGYESRSSNVEVFIRQTGGKDVARRTAAVKKEIKNIVGADFYVHDQYEQQATLYKMMKSEKLAVNMILVFILIMATFNVVGSLSLLIIEKKKDSFVLQTMGADDNLLQRIFLNEGMIISVFGGIIGMIIGIIAVLLQQYVGIIRLGGGDGGNYIVDYYPVALEFPDIIYTLAVITIIGCVAAFATVKVSMNKH